MKQTHNILLIALLIISAFAIPLGLAETEAEVTTTISVEENSTTESVPSTFKYGWEKFKTNFIRNASIRAEKELQLARWKVAEARLATQNGNIEKAEKALQENEKIMQKVQSRVAKMENSSMTSGLDNAIRVHQQRMDSLSMSLENANLSEQQKEKIEMRISKIGNISQKLEQNRERIQEQRQENSSQVQESSGQVENQQQNKK